jgi:hypothetical protein
MLGKKCGTCGYAKIVDQDITKRLCHGAPPSAMQIRAPIPGQMTLQMARPIVSVTDDACALYRERIIVDITNSKKEVRMPTPDSG